MKHSSSRRDFLKLTATAAIGGGLLLGFGLPARGEVRDSLTADAPFAPNAFLRIDRAGKATFVMPMIEMGQGTYTSLPMLIAEELEVDVDKVSIEHAPADDKVYVNPLVGVQMTGASTAIRAMYVPLRRAGATARVMLVTAAAQRWKVDPSSCRAENGAVVHAPSGRKLGYGALVDDAAKLPVPEKVALKNPRTSSSSERRIAASTRRARSTARQVRHRHAAAGNEVRRGGAIAHVRREADLRDEAKASAVPGFAQVGQARRRSRDRGHAHVVGQAGARRRGAAVGPGTEREALHGRHRRPARHRVGKARRGRAQRWRRRGRHRARRAKDRRCLRAALSRARDDGAHELHGAREQGRLRHLGRHPGPRPHAGGRHEAHGLAREQVRIHNHLLGGGFGRRLEYDGRCEPCRSRSR
jgi:hypothetical protein